MSYSQKYNQTYGPSSSYGSGNYGSGNRGSGSYSSDDDTNWGYVAIGGLLVAAGAYLIFRGVNQDDDAQLQRNNDRYAPYRNQGSGIQVRESIVVEKSDSELYRYWRKLENLPTIMSHLESVTEMGNRSHWKAKGPLGMNPEWDAVITDERENETISWRSLENAQVPNEGTVRFSKRDDNSTEVIVSLTYHPPLGPVGAAVAKLFGEEPSQQIKDDLQNFKQSVEGGTISLNL